MTTAYGRRPSPTEHADAYAVGCQKLGNNGLMHVVQSNSSGTKRWVTSDEARRFAKSLKTRGHAVYVGLRPRLVCDDDRANTLIGPERVDKLLASKKALEIAWMSASALLAVYESNPDVETNNGSRVFIREVLHNQSIASHDHTFTMYVSAETESAANKVIECAKKIYGELAKDTWMRDDIGIAPGVRMTFDLLYASNP